jgi:predicted ester cyclase
MNSQPGQTASNYMDVASRWFTAGWTGDLAVADELFSESLRTNGVLVGVAGPKDRILARLKGFPDIVTSIEDMFAAGDKLVIRLVWRGTHSGQYGGVEPTGKTVEVRDTAIWRFSGGKVTEIWTMQDQFAFLKQTGFLPDHIVAA